MKHTLIFFQSTLLLFFFNDTATTEIYTLSLHDALPIFEIQVRAPTGTRLERTEDRIKDVEEFITETIGDDLRSEEHTSELQSRRDLVCRLLLEKKKKKKSKYK